MIAEDNSNMVHKLLEEEKRAKKFKGKQEKDFKFT
jgi:hypothetical protein